MKAWYTITGDIKSKGDIRVDGSLKGSIETEGKVVVGQGGVVEGDVVCQDADVAGVLKAKITVSQLLSLKSSAKLNGDIVTNKLSIEPGATFSGSCSMGAVIKDIKDQISDNKVLLFMKGSPYQPQCGFSSKVAQILFSYDIEFSYIDVLEFPEVRANLPKISDWPTFPQLYIKGELVGGCDITLELFESGELKKMVDEATA